MVVKNVREKQIINNVYIRHACPVNTVLSSVTIIKNFPSNQAISEEKNTLYICKTK